MNRAVCTAVGICVLAGLGSALLGAGLLREISQPVKSPPVSEARARVEQEFLERTAAILVALPKDASLSRKVAAVRELFEEEHRWQAFFEGMLYTESLRRGKWDQTVHVDYEVRFASLAATFSDADKAPQGLREEDVARIMTELAAVHALRRQLAVQLQKLVLGSMIKPEKLHVIWPDADGAAIAKNDVPAK